VIHNFASGYDPGENRAKCPCGQQWLINFRLTPSSG